MDGKIERVKTIGVELKVFDYLAKDSDYISVTEWSNGEGWDIYIGDDHIGLTLGQLKAMDLTVIFLSILYLCIHFLFFFCYFLMFTNQKQ